MARADKKADAGVKPPAATATEQIRLDPLFLRRLRGVATLLGKDPQELLDEYMTPILKRLAPEAVEQLFPD